MLRMKSFTLTGERSLVRAQSELSLKPLHSKGQLVDKVEKDGTIADGVDLIGYISWGPIDLVSVSTEEMKNATASFM
ncbi:hypothetical protein Saga11_21240 [Bacillus safensis]|nr:hypothetical protein Saga11_21240 [Bacillus safensis]